MSRVGAYGWVKDAPDSRDHLFAPREVPTPTLMPKVVDLVPEFPFGVWDQLQIGSCQPHATGSIYTHRSLLQGEPFVMPSRLALYWWARYLEGTTDQDAGSSLRDGIKVLAKYGAPPEDLWPYSDLNPGPFLTQPPQPVVLAGIPREALAYKRIVVGTPGAPMRTAVVNHHPIAFGFQVPPQFEDPNWDPTKTALPIPDANIQFIGGHAVVVVGFDFSLTRFPVPVFKIRNSWGAQWGDAGHFYMDYRWFDASRGLADDLWIITQVK